ncbi:hypothetical protein BDR07DRAFT_1524325 [Suillus spraguei]|nr:hypothetical protein BDR07DRAFT_1524325 [Suillus spraguei]
MSTTDRHTKPDRSRKIFQQRRYRSTEAEDFSQLRQIIRDVSQENPHTRHDILTKALILQCNILPQFIILLAPGVENSGAECGATAVRQKDRQLADLQIRDDRLWLKNWCIHMIWTQDTVKARVTGAARNIWGYIWGAVSTMAVGGFAAAAAYGLVVAVESARSI